MIEIREAGLSDVDDIRRLFADTIRNVNLEDYTWEETEEWAKSADDRMRWIRAIEEQYFLVATLEDKVVGFASLEDRNYLDFLYVHHKHQRQGVAQELYNAVETKAKQLKSNDLFSHVSITARPFFERQGFFVEKKNENRRGPEVLINFTMRKHLTP